MTRPDPLGLRARQRALARRARRDQLLGTAILMALAAVAAAPLVVALLLEWEVVQ